MTAKELFEVVLPRILRESPERARELGGAIAFELHGKGGGVWSVEVRARSPKVVSGVADGVVCTVTAEVADFEAMLEDPKAALPLYQGGKIKVAGDTTVATSFHRLLR